MLLILICFRFACVCDTESHGPEPATTTSNRCFVWHRTKKSVLAEMWHQHSLLASLVLVVVLVQLTSRVESQTQGDASVLPVCIQAVSIGRDRSKGLFIRSQIP